MEAKDTVMSNDKIILKEVRTPTGESLDGRPVVHSEKVIDIDATLLAQAEISFKAGIREVVGWIQSQFEDGTGKDSIEQILAIPKYKMRAKLKEWGIAPITNKG